MSAAPIRRPAPGAGAGPDLRTPSQPPHLALVSAASSAVESARAARTPEEAFGARLRAARERRGISLKSVAERTKVTTTLFEALERGNVSRWPKGIYKRSFFRGYVEAIGLPTESTTEEFLRLFPDETPAEPQADPSAESPTPPADLRLTLAPAAERRPLLARMSRAAVLDAVAVLIAAAGLSWWSGLEPAVGAAFVALCWYPQVARLVRRRAAAQTPGAVRSSSFSVLRSFFRLRQGFGETSPARDARKRARSVLRSTFEILGFRVRLPRS